MTTAIKCSSCNIVINELLAYIQNKISIVDEDSLVKICLSTFNSDQVSEAKTLLFESISAEHRRRLRKGQGKENRELYDIISLFKVTDPDVIPVFVARDLDKLPPITFDHLDVSKLLKDLLLVQSDIKEIKESYVTKSQLEDIRMNVQNMRKAVTPYSMSKVNMKRGAATYQDSGPIGLSHLNDSSQTEENASSNCASSPKEMNLKYRNVNFNPMEGREIIEMNATLLSVSGGIEDGSGGAAAGESRGGAGRGEDAVPSLAAGNEFSDQLIDNKVNRSFSNALKSQTLKSNEREKQDNESNGGWMLAQRRKPYYKRYRLSGKMGNSTVEPEQKFKAADRKIPIFITNVHMGTLKSDIIKYIYNKTNESVSLEKIVMKKKNEYDAYKFFVSESKLQMFLNENLWPQGVIFRRFVHFRTKTTGNIHVSNDGTTNKCNG